MLRIRLRRTGAKKHPSYRVVVADLRAARDGSFVDYLGNYDPMTDPATINIDRDKFDSWVNKGAQPSDSVASLIKTLESSKGES